MNKEKQIKIEIKSGAGGMCDLLNQEIAELLYEQGYRKINDNEVVISKEEYEKLKQFEHRVRSGVCLTQKEWFDFCNEDSNRRTCLRIEEREKERKETAKKFVYLLTNNGERQTFPLKDNNDIVVDKAYVIPQSFLNQVAKEFGVDLGEKNG